LLRKEDTCYEKHAAEFDRMQWDMDSTYHIDYPWTKLEDLAVVMAPDSPEFLALWQNKHGINEAEVADRR
jgi:hypothetical protein